MIVPARSFDRRSKLKIAILDDYQNVALSMADWTYLRQRAEIAVFTDHLSNEDDLIERLLPFDVVCVMRERTAFTRHVLQRLPRLKLIASTGPSNAAIDGSAEAEFGIAVRGTRYFSTPAVEMTWALILAAARGLVRESNALRNGSWQQGVGVGLAGKILGVVGLGNVGGPVARIGAAFGMKVNAWSENLTPSIAEGVGARYVSKADLFREADIVTIHIVLSDRSRGLVGAAELALMKPTSLLVNASRGPIVDEEALVHALKTNAIAGAAIDAFNHEPLSPEHPLRTLVNVLATPHIGYVVDDLYRTFFADIVGNITAWLDSVSVE
jgi:phosphoglycerate dehydrogenase-like enzyme